ncbi:hypothetical protein BS78_02G055000 [Paspalum vaginatum]|nr:hypothetical protein BS78_02G055000 [Paspalum vaginatum]
MDDTLTMPVIDFPAMYREDGGPTKWRRWQGRRPSEQQSVVCSVIDSTKLSRNTHPDREFVEEADKASMRIYEHLQG